jgi:hypothetical protein
LPGGGEVTAMPTDAETASFEIGIKFGTLFHQFVGTPVSPDSIESLEPAIEEAIENQPYCETVAVDIDPDAVAADLGPYGYTGLQGHHMTVEMAVEFEGIRATASMAMDGDYPKMSLDRVTTP